MAQRLKKLNSQVIVITGATSGIGLTTARMAATRGARVVLAARNEEELKRVVSQIRSEGGKAIYVVADVADTQAVQEIADRAIEEFGGFDTWVNNAGISIYGKLTEVPMDEKKRLFEVNFWGVVNGCRSAVKHLRGRGGSIINLGSILSERAIPIQGMYSASKHAVKAYTDALRMELEEEGLPISVTLIKPSGINTPYTEHARNHREEFPTLPPPVYAPEVVARAILRCAEHPMRDVIVGGGGKVFSWMEKWIPGLTDKMMERTLPSAQMTRYRPDGQHENLFSPPAREGKSQGDYPGHVMKSSLYTSSVLHPFATFAIVAGLGTLVFAWSRLKREEHDWTLRTSNRFNAA